MLKKPLGEIMDRLIIVSNRLPITIEKRKGKLHFRRSVGGLATGLISFYQLYDSIWIGWCGIPADNIDRKETAVRCRELLSIVNALTKEL